MMGRLVTPWDDHHMLPAFLGCVHWALGKEDMVEAFRAETGNDWEPGETGTDRMIDSAVGADIEFMQQFSDWVATTVFGKPEDLEGNDE